MTVNEGELNKPTEGQWFWSNRTLRSEIKDSDGFIEETVDILRVDTDRCIYAPNPADKTLIESAKQLQADNAALVEALGSVPVYNKSAIDGRWACVFCHKYEGKEHDDGCITPKIETALKRNTGGK